MATKKSAVKDLTNGSPVKLILGFALPLLLGMLFQQFYSMVDTIIVGKFLGAKALAAVGRFDQLHDRGILYGSLQRICNSGCADVRGRRPESAVPVCRKWSRPGRYSFRGDDRSCLHLVPRHSDSDENPVRYSGRCIRLHLCYFPRNSAYGAL